MIDEDFDLPLGWSRSSLGVSAVLVKTKVDPAASPDAPYVGLEHIEAHTMRLLAHGRGADVKSAKRKFSAGDVLYGKLRPYLNKVARPTFDGMCSTDLLVFTESEHLDCGYLAHYLNQLWFANEAHHLSNGLELPRVDWKALSQISVNYPTAKAQQRAVVAQIDEARRLKFSAGDHLAAASRAIEQLRQAVLAAGCSGRLTADWREANPVSPIEPGPALSAQAAKNASGAPNTSDLVDVPETWAWWAVESITDRVIDYRGRTPPSEPTGAIPHIRTTQIRHGRIDWNANRFVTREVYDEYMTRGLPHRGDVLFTMEAPMGEVGVVDRDEPFSIAQRILLMRPGDGLDSGFLCLALRSHPVQRAIEFRSTGSGVPGISYKRLRSILLPKPPINEQREIARRTREILELADAVEKRIEAADARIDRSSQAVLTKAFRGELVSAP